MSELIMKNPIFIVLFMNTVFSGVLAFSNLYINIFLWNQGASLSTIGVYNASVFVSVFIGTMIGAYTMRWMNSRMTFVLSSSFLLAVFGLLISKEENVIGYIIILGTLYGTAVGLYYSGFNLYSILLTNPENRQLFMGMEQGMNRITAVLTPLIFSYLILYYDYNETFRLIFVMLIIQVIISLFTPKYKSNFNISSLRYKDIWKEYKAVLVSIVAFGFFQSIIQLASSILLFQYVQKETIVGWLNTLFAITGILTLVFISRPRLVKSRMKVTYVGAILATVMTIFLFFPSFSTLIIFNVLAAIALPLIWIPVSVIHYTKIKELACESEVDCDIGLTAHYLLIREFMLNVGRTSFYLFLIMGLDFTQGYHYIPIFLFSLVIPLVIYICNKGLFRELG
ncbi:MULTISPECIES: MFS transporter [Bacillaceae]|nr:MFS transporter [Cytobacillus oceanisediminis]MCM3244570.1 MFS transporter [Cytobacillus oceanisediminis]